MDVKQISFDYDEEADSFYITIGKPKKAITEEIGNVGIRVDEKTKEIVGVTIIEFSKLLKKDHKPIVVSIPERIQTMHV